MWVCKPTDNYLFLGTSKGVTFENKVEASCT